MKVNKLLYNYIRMHKDLAKIKLTPEEILLFNTLKTYKL